VIRRNSLAWFLGSLGLSVISSASYVNAQSIWDHNGSTVVLEAQGASRKFYYQNPRTGLSVAPGTLLFEGRRSENRYTGTAYLFSRNCEPIGYEVSGPVSQDQRRVVLRGKAPRRDANCNVTSYRDDVLRFELKESFAHTDSDISTQGGDDTVDNVTASAQNTTATVLLRYSIKCVPEPRFIDETWKELRSAEYVGNDKVFKLRTTKHRGAIGGENASAALVEVVDDLTVNYDQIDSVISKGPVVTLNCKNNSKCITYRSVTNPNTSETSARRARLSTAKIFLCDQLAADDVALAINNLKQ
jgi:hypothetical protein